MSHTLNPRRLSIGAVLAALALLLAVAPPAVGANTSDAPPGGGGFGIDQPLDANHAQAPVNGTGFNKGGIANPGTLRFIWPLEARGSLPGMDLVAAKINFIDHDERHEHLEDYEGGERTYDIPGYNHDGTDLSLWPAPWAAMDANIMAVVAAADGEIIVRQDGNYDRNCAFTSAPANYVIIRHDNGWTSLYTHLKEGTVTSAQVGDQVEAGDFLGFVGSSGSSTAPHLHFEVRDNNGDMVDPWNGPFNPTTPVSVWANQRPYFEPSITKVSASAVAPSAGGCDPSEFGDQEIYDPGDRIYIAVYPTETPANTPIVWTLYTPDGSEYSQRSFSTPQAYGASWWYHSWDLPENGSLGRWSYRVTVGDLERTGNFVLGTADVCNGRAVTVDLGKGEQPTDGDDVILGTSGADVVNAGAGDDLVCARGGADRVKGGPGNDVILGQKGADRLWGGSGDDELQGGSGKDRLKGGKGNDLVVGGSGKDKLWGNGGLDRLRGKGGNDTLKGGKGADALDGYKGNDRCIGGPGADTTNRCERLS